MSARDYLVQRNRDLRADLLVLHDALTSEVVSVELEAYPIASCAFAMN